MGKMGFKRFRSFVFDLDGTVWLWDRLVPGAEQVIAKLQSSGKHVLFVTNNTVLSRRKLVKKLRDFGVDVDEKRMINAGYIAAVTLKKIAKRKKVLAFGNGLKEDLRALRVRVTGKLPADYVVIGHDLRFDYMKLLSAFEAVQHSAKLYATARGLYFPVGSRLYPGTGVLVHAVEYATGQHAELLGKPSKHAARIVRAFNPFSPNKTVLVGDELASDIAIGKTLGYHTVLVQTGVDKGVKMRGLKPDVVLKSIADIKI